MSAVVRSSPKTRNIYLYDREDACNVCATNHVVVCCDKCSETVCASVYCCSVFPYYNNTVFVVCRVCFETIDRKLKAVAYDDAE